MSCCRKFIADVEFIYEMKNKHHLETAEEQWDHKDQCQHWSSECKTEGSDPRGRQLKNYWQIEMSC